MPYKDPDKQRAATRDAVKRHRARKGAALDDLGKAIQEAQALPEPPSREVLLKALGVQAVNGNVPAIRLLLEEYRRDENPDQETKSRIDELAARRSGRAG
jgi:hypothetical protein